MTKIAKSADCGNSPKNLLVQALVIAIETRNRTSFARCVGDDVTWFVPGRKVFEGKATALAWLASRKADLPQKLTVTHALAHGRAGAGNGVILSTSGETSGFCHVVEFTSAKGDRIARIISYYSSLSDEQD